MSVPYLAIYQPSPRLSSLKAFCSTHYEQTIPASQKTQKHHSSSTQPDNTTHRILKGTCGHPLVLHDLKQDKQHCAFFQMAASL
jgi:hypothetical protein